MRLCEKSKESKPENGVESYITARILLFCVTMSTYTRSAISLARLTIITNASNESARKAFGIVKMQSKMLHALSLLPHLLLALLNYVYFAAFLLFFNLFSQFYLPLLSSIAGIQQQKEFQNFNYACNCNGNYEKPQNSFFAIDFYTHTYVCLLVCDLI